VISEGKQKVISEIERFIVTYKIKAKNYHYHFNDDKKCFKRIYALADLFPVDEDYHRNVKQIEWQLKELWYLYFYFKHRIDGNKYTYTQIVIKYD
jgi:hypothetical protein|tara:strand:- start:359 stop:643 length:285 start_codon:yes stop_codon:yes gene_type:complete